MVLEVRRVIPVGVQRHQLAGGILQPGGGYGFLGDLIDAGGLGARCVFLGGNGHIERSHFEH